MEGTALAGAGAKLQVPVQHQTASLAQGMAYIINDKYRQQLQSKHT